MDREARQYWKSRRNQMLKRDRQQRGGFSTNMPVTKILIGLIVLAWLIENFVPGILAAITGGPVGIAVSLILSALSPGSLLGLLFTGVFLWIIGSQLESLTLWWQYVLIFFVSGIVGALLSLVLGAGLVGGTFASFGLAGAYVMAMASRRVGGVAQWAIVLLAINVILSGFQAGVLGGMLGAFFAGLIIARAARI
jgi:membrane associated rhomboid family serine protease